MTGSRQAAPAMREAEPAGTGTQQGGLAVKLSIIIPVYNTRDYLNTCLASVTDEGCADCEILVINDGSTDDSGALAQEWAERFPALIRVITTENGGLGAARNVGLENARGDYLLFLDSDDSLEQGALAEILSALDGSFDIGIFDLLQVNPTGEAIGTICGSTEGGRFTLAENPRLLLDPPSACNKLFRRSLFTDSGIRFPGRVWFEDLRTVPKLYPLAGAILYMPRAWYRYLVRPGSITNSANTARNLEIIDAVEEILRWYRQEGLYERYEAELCAMAHYNTFLTSSVRVNAADPRSDVQEKLLGWFVSAFPDWRENAYLRALPPKHRLLSWLLMHRMRRSVHAIMQLNDARKNKRDRFQ